MSAANDKAKEAAKPSPLDKLVPSTKTLLTLFDKLGRYKYFATSQPSKYNDKRLEAQIDFINKYGEFLERMKATYKDFKNSDLYPYEKKETK